MRYAFRLLLLCWLASAPAGADDSVPANIIRLPSTVTTIFIADTASAEFHQFENKGNNEIAYRGDSTMSIGKNGDGKQRHGDRKTPLGIYFVTEQLDTSRMHEKYGRTAFVLDYPNSIDRRYGRTGDGIWVHGVDPRSGERPPRDTDGCIALPNESLEKIEDQFSPNMTPVLIGRDVRWAEASQIDELRSELDAALSRWGNSLQRGDLHTFLSQYDADFRHWGMNKTEWIAFRAKTLGTRSIEKITISDVLLLGDPAEEGIYLSRFRLRVEEASNTVELTKRLYWRRAASGALQIVAEDAG